MEATLKLEGGLSGFFFTQFRILMKNKMYCEAKVGKKKIGNAGKLDRQDIDKT